MRLRGPAHQASCSIRPNSNTPRYRRPRRRCPIMLGSGRESSRSDGITEQRNLQRTSATKSAHRYTYRGAKECRLCGEERTLAGGGNRRRSLGRGIPDETAAELLIFRNLSLCNSKASDSAPAEISRTTRERHLAELGELVQRHCCGRSRPSYRPAKPSTLDPG